MFSTSFDMRPILSTALLLFSSDMLRAKLIGPPGERGETSFAFVGRDVFPIMMFWSRLALFYEMEMLKEESGGDGLPRGKRLGTWYFRTLVTR